MSNLALVVSDQELEGRLAEQENAALAVLASLDRILPPMDPAHVEALAESMRLQGYFPHEPLLRYKLPDRSVVTIIGRHREAAAAMADVEPAVEYFKGDAVEAVYRMTASVLGHRYLDETQRAAVKRALESAGYSWSQIVSDRGLRVTREEIEAALLSQASTAKPLNHRAIARALHIDWSRLRVDRACAALVANGSLDHCPHQYTEEGSEARGVKTGRQRPVPVPPAPPAPEPPAPEPVVPVTGTGGGHAQADGTRPAPTPPGHAIVLDMNLEYAALDAEIRRRILAGEPTQFRALAEQFGIGPSAVQNRIQWNQGWLAARAPHPDCLHDCYVHCPPRDIG